MACVIRGDWWLYMACGVDPAMDFCFLRVPSAPASLPPSRASGRAGRRCAPIPLPRRRCLARRPAGRAGQSRAGQSLPAPRLPAPQEERKPPRLRAGERARGSVRLGPNAGTAAAGAGRRRLFRAAELRAPAWQEARPAKPGCLLLSPQAEGCAGSSLAGGLGKAFRCSWEPLRFRVLRQELRILASWTVTGRRHRGRLF